MSHTHITINGQVVLDDHLGEWQHKPPQQLADIINRKQTPQPGMTSLLVALAEAATKQQPLNADLQSSPTGWKLTVTTG
jgi:hypothetical protein